MRERAFLFLSRAASSGGWRSSGRSSPPRIALLVAIAGAHLLVLLWLLAHPSPLPRAPAGDGPLILVTPSRDRGPSVTPRQRVVPPRAETAAVVPPPPIELPNAQAAAAPAAAVPLAAGGAAGGHACALAADAGAAIARDPAAMTELATLPPGVRTEADAVMLWNGKWLGESLPPPGGNQALVAARLRAVVETLVAAAPPECRDAAMTGPVFLPIPQDGRTTMLVIGSGRWRWSDMLAQPAICTGSPANVCAPTVASP